MRELLKKRWHRIPVALVSAMLVIALVAGGAFAAYKFFEVDLQVQVEEAIAVGFFDSWDNLHPYGSDPLAVWVDSGGHDDGMGVLGDVTIAFGGTEEAPVLSITTIPGYDGAGFVGGEWIVIPMNLRNAGDGTLNLSASVWGNAIDHLSLKCSFEENFGPESSFESGQSLCREYEAVETFGLLDEWTGTIGPKGGKSGSAVVGAQVLFVKVSAPGDVTPGNYTFTVTLDRS